VLTGADPGQYAESADTCTGQPVPAAGTCTVAVAFAPTTAGAKSAALRLTDNTTGSPHDVALTGAGSAAPLTTSPPGPAPGPSARCQGQAATVLGTTGADTLTGTTGPDVIAGLGGDDLILGLGGDDIVCAGPGDDKVAGGTGADLLYGGTGDDRLTGNQDDDTLAGRTGTDRCTGGSGTDQATCERTASATRG
jgi:Ca2+-binding RTX toxin-like protein